MKVDTKALLEDKSEWMLLKDADGKVLHHPCGPLIKQRHKASYNFYPDTGRKEHQEDIIRIAVSDTDNVDQDIDKKIHWASPQLTCQLNSLLSSQQKDQESNKVRY